MLRPQFEKGRRLNIAYLTSSRELAGDESVGRQVVDPLNGTEYGYRMGNLEAMARLLQDESTEFSNQFNLVTVITDDDDDQHAEAWQIPIWPVDLPVPQRDSRGNPEQVAKPALADITTRISSHPWRCLRRDRTASESKEAFRSRKAEAKAAYEREIINLLERKDVDLIVTDSYMSIVGPTFLEAYEGRILNIHPAITDTDDPCHLLGAPVSRGAYTRATQGWIIIDDIHGVPHPNGEVIQVEYEGETRTAVRVPHIARTGVTVHVTNARIDDGPLVMNDSYEFDPNNATPEFIRNQSYVIKRNLLPRAMLHYVVGHQTESKYTPEQHVAHSAYRLKNTKQPARMGA